MRTKPRAAGILVGLRLRLILSITLVSMLAIFMLSVIVNFFLENQFRQYAVKKQEERNLEIVSLVSKQYLGAHTWQAGAIENIGVSILEESLILQVTDAAGITVWDAVEYNSGICHAMMEEMANRMLLKYPTLNGGLSHKEYAVLAGGQVVGTVKIGYYGPFYYSDSEFFFIDTINKVLFFVALFSLGLSLGTGFILAAAIAAPISAVTKLAADIAAGNYRSIAIRSRTREVHDLILTINHMSAALGSQEQLRRRLTGDVAHELRTPLATLRAEIEAMLDGINKASRQSLQSCLEEILRLTGLVHDMETLSRFDADALALQITAFDLGELAASVTSLHAQLAAGKGITVQCTGTELRVQADKEKTSQVILNLFANACQFTPAGGTITLTTVYAQGRPRFSIRDTGSGIPAADLPHIFERFYRVDRSRTRSAGSIGGSGIGLTIVREIVKAHNWEIKVTSTPGTGSEFTILM